MADAGFIRDFIGGDEVSELLKLYLAEQGGPGEPAPEVGGGGKNGTKPVSQAAKVQASAPKRPPLPPQPVFDPDAPLVGEAFTSPAAGPAAAETFYITTAINYTNGNPHIGHAYEAVTSDIIARYNRVYGRDVFFQTGTDEHGQKIANTAAGLGIKPIEMCDKYVAAFKALNRLLRISNNFFIRTSMEFHHKVAQDLWTRCADVGDIYLGVYEGWYNEREETFVTEMEATQSEYKDPVSGVPLKKMEERSYFFRLSKYRERLVEHIKTHPDFVQPEMRRNFILARLEDELMDLSISRTTFDWGLPVPPGFDKEHVMYVWFDALSNYLSGVHGLEPGHELSRFWPADVHVIGKDIMWFHCVIWPSILMSAGVPLPKMVFAHGFVNGKDGRKMSKSLGNVVDPHDLLGRYPVDSFRFYLTKDPFGGDVSFNEDALVAYHNGELADVLGNLVHRAVNLCHKFCGGVVPELDLSGGWGPYPLPFDLETLRGKVEEAMRSSYNIKLLGDEGMSAMRDTNKFLTDAAPWAMKGDDRDLDRKMASHSLTHSLKSPSAVRLSGSAVSGDLNQLVLQVVRLTMEAVYLATHFLAPLIPYAATAIFKKLGTPQRPIPTLRADFVNLLVGQTVEVGEILFVKIDVAGGQAEVTDKAVSVQGKGKGKCPAPAADIAVDQPDFSKIDIRVGKIVKVWNHPDAERLFCEEIDIGEGAPRFVASGLREHYTLEAMLNRKVLCVANLKAARLAGFESHGMLLAASHGGDGGRVELVEVPEGAAVGERVGLEGHVDMCAFAPLAPAQVKKKKAWEAVAFKLKTSAEGIVTFDEHALVTSKGKCFAPTIRSGIVR